MVGQFVPCGLVVRGREGRQEERKAIGRGSYRAGATVPLAVWSGDGIDAENGEGEDNGAGKLHFE